MLVVTVKLTVIIDSTVLQALMRKKIVIFAFLIGIALASSATLLLISPFNSSLNLNMGGTSETRPPTSLDFVEEIMNNLEWGNIVFDTPKKIKFEEPKIIELLLSPTKSIQELQSSLKSHEKTESARIQISNRMEAISHKLRFVQVCQEREKKWSNS
jgi:beta-glucanase (GH16 family)